MLNAKGYQIMELCVNFSKPGNIMQKYMQKMGAFVVTFLFSGLKRLEVLAESVGLSIHISLIGILPSAIQYFSLPLVSAKSQSSQIKM